jgi:hypothetical protein
MIGSPIAISCIRRTEGGAVRAVLLDYRGYVALLRLHLARSGYTSGPLFRASVNGGGGHAPSRRRVRPDRAGASHRRRARRTPPFGNVGL